ncbi:MAG: peptidoglycan-binding protein [Myxococcaceae bacterium]|nr:peptidoglycan-binding protein [Myxococcaceae bacterium]
MSIEPSRVSRSSVVASPGAPGSLPQPYAQYAPMVMEAARRYNLPPELLFGIMMRESNGQNIRGDGGHGRGLMQIDDRSHGAWLAANQGGMDPASNIMKGAEILRQSIDAFGGDVRKGLAAYNAGVGGVRRALGEGRTADSATTGGDYGAAVLRNAEQFSRALGGAPIDLGASTRTAPVEDPQVARHNLLRFGARGPEVEQLQERLRAAGFEPGASGVFDAKTEEAVRQYQQAKGLSVDGVVGQQTWGSFYGKSYPPGSAMLRGTGFVGYATDDTYQPGARRRRATSTEDAFVPAVDGARTTPSSGAVDSNHPWLRALATQRLDEGPTGSCVRTTLDNMERLGITGVPAATGEDPNNSRGAMVQLLRGGQWSSLPLPGAQPRTIRSPYGTVQAQVISADAYERLAQAGQIPSGALIFQTRHGWDYSGGPYGNDMGIVRDGGRVTHNYRSMSPIIYRDAREVVILVPTAALR